MTLAEIDLPHIVAGDLLYMVKDAIANQPRTLQQVIGPSEIGACPRKVIHTLAGTPVPPARDPAWLAYIGSCVHAGLDSAITHHPINQGMQPRFLTEHRVNVGTAGGQEIWGTADVFDLDSGTVGDWKIVGPDRLLHYATHGPGNQYRVQAHLYGRGFARLGYVVNHVMILFLPRNGKLDRHHIWAEPYDETIALDALSRIDALVELIGVLGKEAVLDLYPPCNDWFCPWCRKPRTTPVRAVPTTTIQLFD